MLTYLQKYWYKLALAGIGLVLLGFVAVSLLIGKDVRDAVAEAQARFPGEPVPALIAVVQSPESPLVAKNRAVWALGQLGSQEALACLESLVTGKECDHEAAICQDGLEKAVTACSGGTNLGALVWRHGQLASAAGS